MEISDSLIFTFILAMVSATIEIAIMLVLFFTIREAKRQNKHTTDHLKSQMNIEKNSITFLFADWVSREVKYYSPLYKENKDREYVLSADKIDTHLIAIAKKVVKMSNEKIIDFDIIKDEIERLILTLDNMEKEPTLIISDLKKLL